uniref:Uncharacterized protein LOC111113482 n=1 Tax=Crassostrea virginica TaxID=6565 RepID=A0A8B8BW23_CRAVI|nr:uncharacterized protein LOC111113482 [Crassostrea virginica]
MPADIDQKISTTGKQFTTQPDTTERRKTANSNLEQKISTAGKQFTSEPATTERRKTDTTFVSSLFMASKFEIPTSTSPTVLSTDTTLVSSSFMASKFEIPTPTSPTVPSTVENS